MTAAPAWRPVLPAALAALAGGALIGGALTQRAPPDISVLPDMVPVALSSPLWVQRYEVTVLEWNACADAGACARALAVRRGMDPASTPATGINHPEATAFAAWISERTGHPFRLPRAREWSEIAAEVVDGPEDPLFDQPELDWASAYLTSEAKARALRHSGAFSTTSDGVADLDGSVWEWTSDCFAGSAGPAAPGRCPAFWVGGEHLAAMSFLERDPARGGCAVGTPPAHLGLRLVTDSTPPRS